MTIAWVVVLILGIVGIIVGCMKVKGSEDYRSSTFWFLLAFWAYIVLAPWAGRVLAVT